MEFCLGDLRRVPKHSDSTVKLPNLYVAVFDILARVIQCGGVVGSHEIMAPDDLAHRRDCERPIVCHAILPKVFSGSCKSAGRCVN